MTLRRILCATLFASAAALGAGGPLIKLDIWEDPIRLTAESIQTWKEAGQPRGFLFTGKFRWMQGDLQIEADRGAAWFDEEQAKETGEAAVDIYAEGRVTILQRGEVARYERILIHASSAGAGAGLCIEGGVKTLKAKPTDKFLLRGEAQRAQSYTDFATTEPYIETPGGVRLPKFEEVSIPTYRDFSFQEDKATGQMVFTIIGPVEIHRRDTTVTADNIIVWARPGKAGEGKKQGGMKSFEEFYAEGNVTLTRHKDVITASRVYENVAEDRGVYYDCRLALESGSPAVYCQAKEVWHTGKGQYEARNASFSTCGNATPHYDVRGKMVRIIQTPEATVVSSVHNFLRIGGVPVFYVPSITHDINDNEFVIRSFRAGQSSYLGTFVETRWAAYQLLGIKSKNTDADLMLDYYADRGLGTGLDFDYGGANGFGEVLGYYINDSANHDYAGRRVEKQNRGRFLWRHRSELGDGWRGEAELSYLTDRTFLRDYFEDEFKEGKEQETVLYLRKLKGNKGLRATASARINDFDTQVERQPAINFDIIGQPFWDDTIVYTSSYEAANLSRKIDDNLHVTDPKRTLRFHTDQEFAVPFKLWIMRFNPFYKIQFTAADEGRKGPLAARSGRRRRSTVTEPRSVSADAAGERALVGQRSSGSVTRVAQTVGVNASTDFWRVYNVSSKRLDVNRLKHIMTPEVRWEFTPTSSTSAARFNQFDEVDRIDKFHRVMFGYRNRLQTKRGKPGHEHTVNFMDLDMEAYFHPSNDGRSKEYDDWFQADYSYAIRDWLTFSSQNNEFNFNTSKWEVANAGLKLDLLPRWSTYVGHTYIRDTSSAMTLEVEHLINERWTVRFFEQYDFNYQLDGAKSGSKNMDTALTLRRLLHKWYLDMIFEFDKGKDDVRLSLALSHVGSESRLRRY